MLYFEKTIHCFTPPRSFPYPKIGLAKVTSTLAAGAFGDIWFYLLVHSDA